MQDTLRDVYRVAVTGYLQSITVRMQRHAKMTLHGGEIAVMLAEEA
ncbi:MAG: hypothetical protein ACYDA5_01625 [Vulcanimicrobiaceae bacterium]